MHVHVSCQVTLPVVTLFTPITLELTWLFTLMIQQQSPEQEPPITFLTVLQFSPAMQCHRMILQQLLGVERLATQVTVELVVDSLQMVHQL